MLEKLKSTLNLMGISGNAIITPGVGEKSAIRAATAITGAYVATTEFLAVGARRVHFDFLITGTPTNAGRVVAYLQTSDDGSNWRDVQGLVAATSGSTDNVATIVPSTQPVRPLVAEYNCMELDYPAAALTMKKRITLELGYGNYYRLQVRAANTTGVSTAAAAGTLPTLQIDATVQ